MDYEKKQRLIALRDNMKSYGYIDGVEELESIFPELAESEDKRIRKALVKYFEERNNYRDEDETFNGIPFSDIIAYIEKQKDASKAIEAVDRIDKYIDEHLANAHDMKDSNPDKKYYRGWDDALGKMAGILQDVYSEEKQKEQKPTDRFEEAREKYQVKWSEEDEDMLNSCISSIEEAKENRYAYKETDGDTSYDREINWLKFLRPSWKPSEGQMEALDVAATDYEELDELDVAMLGMLYDELKKLM